MLEKWRDKILDWSRRENAERVMFGVSFVESSFFPLPPDLMLIPMVLARPEAWLRLAIICTMGSVLGAFLGYAIGYFLLDTVGQWLINVYGLQDGLVRFQEMFAQHGTMVILLKGLTPIPFKLVTIASGIAHFPLLPFFLASLVTRGGRFLLLAAVLRMCGERGRVFVEKHLGKVLMGSLVIIIIGIAAVFAF